MSNTASYPQQVALEVSNLCNLSCPICPCFQGADRMVRGAQMPRTMSFKLFQSLAEQIASWPTLPDNIFLRVLPS